MLAQVMLFLCFCFFILAHNHIVKIEHSVTPVRDNRPIVLLLDQIVFIRE